MAANSSTMTTLALARSRSFAAAPAAQGGSVSADALLATGIVTAGATALMAAANRKDDATGGVAWDPPV